MKQRMYVRPGVSLVEVILALTLATVLGATATSAFVTQSRFFDAQEKIEFARGVSRSALQMIMSELRMVEQGGGVVSVTTQQITLRVPYSLGVVCGNTTQLTINRLPVDALTLTNADFSGLAFRSRATGSYTYVENSSLKPLPNPAGTAVCTGAGFTVYNDANGADGETLQGPLPAPMPEVGAPIFLYQIVTYEFRNSLSVPGRIGLWRRTATGEDEELVAPFDPTAGFRFYVNDAAASESTVPVALHTITGIELLLNGVSERPDHDGSHRSVPLTTSVFFKNRQSQ